MIFLILLSFLEYGFDYFGDSFVDNIIDFDSGINNQESYDVIIELEKSIEDIDNIDYCMPY